jgi:hypothetical protein
MFLSVLAYRAGQSGASPLPGEFIPDPDPATANVILCHTTPAESGDVAGVMALVAAGDVVRFIPRGSSTMWTYAVVAAPTLLGDVWSVNVDNPDGGGALVPAQVTDLGFLTAAAPGANPGTAWASLADARRLWPDAVALDDAALSDLLGAAQIVCQTFAAPSIGTDPEPPDTVDAGVVNVRMLAVVYEARELWAASRRDGDVIGFDSYAVRVRPCPPRCRVSYARRAAPP